MSSRVAFMLGAAFGINVVLALMGRGSFGQFLALVPVIWIALVSLSIGSLLYQFGRTSQALRRFATRAIAFGFVAGSCLISLPIGSLVNRYDIEQAKSYCDRLQPGLERQRHETGRYPEDLSHVSTRGQLPRLLRRAEFYRSGGGYYSFSFMDPSGIFNGVEFDSRSGVWSEWD